MWRFPSPVHTGTGKRHEAKYLCHGKKGTMTNYPETKRIARILDIIWRISRSPHRWTRSDLAEAFEVSERTITGDIQIIRHRLQFDLRADYGRGYYFRALPTLPSVSYSIPEALALVLAAHSARQLGGISQQDLSAAIARLSSVIPQELRAMVERFAGDDTIGELDQHRQEMLAVISQAISMNRRLEIVYAAASRGGDETRRQVDPYALVPYLRSWHMIGYCHLREAVRTFKVARIRCATRLITRFDRDEEFDLAAYLNEGWGLMRGLDAPVEQVVLRFQPTAGRWVAEENWHPSQELDWLPDGRLEFRVAIQVTPEFQRWVFRYGREVEVVAPDDLRAWVQDEARAVLNTAPVPVGSKTAVY